MRTTAKTNNCKGVDTAAPMPVHVDKRGYGLLYPREEATRGYGVVQFGSGGPFEEHDLDRMERVTEYEFNKAITGVL